MHENISLILIESYFVNYSLLHRICLTQYIFLYILNYNEYQAHPNFKIRMISEYVIRIFASSTNTEEKWLQSQNYIPLCYKKAENTSYLKPSMEINHIFEFMWRGNKVSMQKRILILIFCTLLWQLKSTTFSFFTYAMAAKEMNHFSCGYKLIQAVDTNGYFVDIAKSLTKK